MVVVKEAPSFGEVHFGSVKLGDARLTRRVVRSADTMLKHPGGTLPDKFNNRAELNAFYDLANNPKATHAKLLAGHFAHTWELARQCTGIVLIIDDGTEVDLSGLDIDDLGPIGNGGCRGLLCHNSLAYDYTGKQALGLVSQILHRRREVPKKESARRKREHPDRESRLWTRALALMKEIPASELPKFLVRVADRGADIFEFIAALEQIRHKYVIRSKSNRNVLVERDGERVEAKLHDHARGLSTLGRRTVDVPSREGRKARQAKVRVAAGKVLLPPPAHPQRGEHGDEPLAAWVVHVLEENPPKGVEPLEWILLTNVPTETIDEACERVDWYKCRWVIEEYHKSQKTGCGMESMQFTTRAAQEAGIAMVSVVATELLRLRDMARSEAHRDRPATTVVAAEYVTALVAYKGKNQEPGSELTVQEFLYGVARLGGHQGRKGDGPPGWLVLWRGWMKLQLLVEGARGAKRKRCG